MENTFLELVAGAAWALASVFGMVEFLKAVLSLEGKAVTIMSFIVGLIYGGALFAAYLVPGIGQYVAGAVFILSLGLVASGYYKFASARWPKAE